MPTPLDRHAIVGEIGATHLRLAIADIDELTTDHYVNFRTNEFASIELALNAYLTSLPSRPARMSLAVAGAVADGEARLFHSAWSFSETRLKDAFSIPVVHLMRDIEAISLCAPLLTQHELLQVAGAVSTPPGPKAVILVERDIEAAIAVPTNAGWKVLCGRAGDMSFGAVDGDELYLINSMRAGSARISLRNILTFAGLSALYDALRLRSGLISSGWNASDIIAAALADEPDPHAQEALHRYATWIGRLAGDLASAYGASGGVYLVSSLTAQLRDFLADENVAASFIAGGGPSGFASTVPLYIVSAQNSALRGAALALS